MSFVKFIPTIVPYEHFNADLDADALRQAMKGFGCREDDLIEILAKRSNKQRLEIADRYKTKFGKDLIADIKSETSGNFETLLVALLTPLCLYYVQQIHDAMAGMGTDEEALIEFLCGLQNQAIHVINSVYKETYKTTLESDIKSDTSGHFRRLLIALSVGGRDEGAPVDKIQALHDAEALLNAGELKLGTDESVFNQILCRRSYAQVREINEQYKFLKGHDLETAIENEFSGSIRKGLKSIVRCAIDRQTFFATRLYKSMAGIGTNDAQLIRIIVVRSEIDLATIKGKFLEKYGKTLKEWIKGDTSGKYRKCLFTLIGEEDEKSK